MKDAKRKERDTKEIKGMLEEATNDDDFETDNATTEVEDDKALELEAKKEA